MKTPWILTAALFLAACRSGGMADVAVNPDTHAPEQGSGLNAQQLVHAQKFMAASANPLATEAGYEVLKQGGSAIDAMIAMQTTLSLVEPQSSGLGGGAGPVSRQSRQAAGIHAGGGGRPLGGHARCAQADGRCAQTLRQIAVGRLV